MATVMSCGTGNWTGPLPGDPDNNAILSANPAFGGIDVSWTYPLVNPHAVAHVLLYRGISSNYAASVKQATVAGNTFYDKITGTAGTRYYYWIQIVSVNGTVGNVIGPASAIARTRIEDLIADLSGKIEASELGLSLRTSVGKITDNYNELTAKIAAFSGNNAAFMAALMQVESGLANALTLISRETTERVNGDSAFASVNEAIAALNKNYVAAILEQSLVRVTAEDALALKITDVEVASKTGVAAAVKTLEFSKIGYSALANTFTAFDGDGYTIVYPVAQYPDLVFPEYLSDRKRIIDKLGVDLWNAKSATKLVWIVGMPLAQAVKSVGISNGASFSTIEQMFSTQQGTNGNLLSQYTVKIDTDGFITGYGLASTVVNDVPESSFKINADYFSIAGPTVPGKPKPVLSPFIVDTANNTVLMNNAMISNLTADKIDTRGLTIKDATGTVIFSAGEKLAGTYIKNAAVDTLKIAGNAVTIADGRTGNGSVPTITMTFKEPARVAVMVSCNFLAGAGSGTAVSCYLTATGSLGVGISVDQNFSACAADVGFVDVVAGTYSFGASTSVSGGTRTIGTTSIVVMGVMR